MMTRYEEYEIIKKQEHKVRYGYPDPLLKEKQQWLFIRLNMENSDDFDKLLYTVLWKLVNLTKELDNIKAISYPDGVSSLTKRRLVIELIKAEELIEIINEHRGITSNFFSEIFDIFDENKLRLIT